MALSDLSQLELLEGALGLIWVIIAIIIGVKVIHKAIILHRTSDLLSVGVCYVFVSSAWWGLSIQFISYGFFDILLNEFTYLLISNIFIPPALFFWIYSYCKILDIKGNKPLIMVYSIFCIFWEIFVIAGLIIDTRLVGTLNSTFDSSHSITLLLIILIATGSFLITGSIFAYKSMKLEDPEVQWKGRFLLLAWICFTIGALLDAALPQNAITLIIIRLILISSAIEFYFGFFLPKKVLGKLVD
ncbi:MAG: hypothetical protein ACFFAO_14275 [Candidatus Hermodarchaeota archaeon]